MQRSFVIKFTKMGNTLRVSPELFFIIQRTVLEKSYIIITVLQARYPAACAFPSS